MRNDRRGLTALRPVVITKDFIKYAEGSALIEMGNTKVICTATIEQAVPPFLKDKNQGWITAEYAMLPRSTATRTRRESATGKIGGRTHEIQRLIGRAMRAVANLKELGEITILLDCDVIQADGGTRTASITGAFVALKSAVDYALQKQLILNNPLNDYVAAVSVGIVDGQIVLDLNYAEDSTADVDMNIVMTGNGRFVEVQGTAENMPFNHQQLNQMLQIAQDGVSQLIAIQRGVLENTTSDKK